MSKKIPQEKEELFNINKEARKHYPKGYSQPSKDATVPVYNHIRGRKPSRMTNRGIFSNYL